MKIADFGFCKPASENGSFSMSQGATGTKRFIAPEILKLMDDKVGKLRGNTTCNVFSLGCLFFCFSHQEQASLHRWSYSHDSSERNQQQAASRR